MIYELEPTKAVLPSQTESTSINDEFRAALAGRKFGTILADPPWQFQNRTGKVAPEHKRLSRYGTMTLQEIQNLPVAEVVPNCAHLYSGFQTLCCPMESWSWNLGDFNIKAIWYGTRFERMAGQTAAASVFISETSQN